MDPSMITPFVSAIQNVFGTMFQLPVECRDPAIKSGNQASHDVSGIISMSGEFVGSVVLSMPTQTAVSIVALFSGETYEADDPDFADAVGEMINMICGNAKASFQRKNVSISCPSVVVGPGHKISTQSDIPCVVIPCDTDCGEVALEVAIRAAEQNAAAA